MATELIDAFDRADADPEVRAVVLTGAGRGFCAGADLGSGGSAFHRPRDAGHRDGGGRVSLRIFESLRPVIVAANGPAVGVGVTMTLPADVRLASPRSGRHPGPLDAILRRTGDKSTRSLGRVALSGWMAG
jgi:enoyl-CoA hydratase/carnithine racemase